MSEAQAWINIAAQTTGADGGYATVGASQTGNDGTMATFYYRQKQDMAASEREGRPIFKDVPYVEIRLPGQKNSVVDRAVLDPDKQRWPEAWARFEQRQTGMVGGTPLEEWPYLTRSRVAELHAMDVHSVEQLAGLPEANAQRLGPDGWDLKKRATQFLQPGDQTIAELRSEKKALEDRVAALEAMVATKQAMPAVEPEPSPRAVAAPAPAVAPLRFSIRRTAPTSNPHKALLCRHRWYDQ